MAGGGTPVATEVVGRDGGRVRLRAQERSLAPGVVVILLWRFIYDPNVGLLNDLLGAVGLGGLRHAWLGEFGTALYAMMFIGFPFVSGTSVLIYLAGLINISSEVMEAAELDG